VTGGVKGRGECVRRRLTCRFGLPFAAALALAAIVPGTAVANFGTLSYRVHSAMSLPVDGEGTVTASCRPDSHVLGGGQLIQAGVRNAMVHSSAPFDGPDGDTFPDDGWRSRIDSFNGAQNTVTEYAICSTRQPKYRKSSYNIGDGPYYAGFRSKCPRRETALGGGIDVSPGYNSAGVVISIPDPPAPTGSWRGYALAGSVPGQRLTGWVICGVAEVSYRTARGQVANNGSGRASAACPAATSLIGGGVLTPIGKFTTEDIRPTSFGPSDGRDGDLVPDDRWSIEADDWGTTGATIEATAVCLR
jgi:hypothetical protein